MGTNPFSRHRLLISALSPIHLGTGTDYAPTDYVVQDETLHAFHGEAAMQALGSHQVAELDKILSAYPNDRMLRDIQRFFYDSREQLIPFAHRRVRLSRTVEAFYHSRIGKVAQHEQGGQKVNNRLEIERTAHAPGRNRSILPGSGLKGAIRTALLDDMMQRNGVPGRFDKKERHASRILQEQIFDYDFKMLHQDPLRLLRISDAMPRNEQADQTEVLFAVNRKKHPVRDSQGQLVNSQAETQGLYQLLECLPAPMTRAFEGELILQQNTAGVAKDWPSWQLLLGEVITACNRFYRPILEQELQAMGQRGYLADSWNKEIRALLEGELGIALEQGHCFLLRVGRHSGAESVTINGQRDIKIMRGRGQKPDWSNTAKTWWLASDERLAQRNLLPFGWLLVEVTNDPPRSMPLLEGFGAKKRRLIADWQQATQTRYQDLREKAHRAQKERMAEMERKRQEEAAEEAAQQAKAQAEAFRKQQAEAEAARQKAEYDALPEWRKAVIELQNLVDNCARLPMPLNKNQFADLTGRLNQFLEAANAWSDADAREVAASAIEDAYNRCGWTGPGLKAEKRDKQVKKRKEQIAGLRHSSS